MAGDERSLEVTCERRSDDAVVVTALGDLDVASADVLRRVLNGNDARASLVVLDMRRIGFIDSSGLAAVLEQQRRATASGEVFGVAVGGRASQVRRLLALTDLSETLRLLDDPEDLFAPSGRSDGDPPSQARRGA